MVNIEECNVEVKKKKKKREKCRETKQQEFVSELLLCENLLQFFFLP
jgi:hypothetical protein